MNLHRFAEDPQQNATTQIQSCPSHEALTLVPTTLSGQSSFVNSFVHKMKKQVSRKEERKRWKEMTIGIIKRRPKKSRHVEVPGLPCAVYQTNTVLCSRFCPVIWPDIQINWSLLQVVFLEPAQVPHPNSRTGDLQLSFRADSFGFWSRGWRNPSVHRNREHSSEHLDATGVLFIECRQNCTYKTIRASRSLKIYAKWSRQFKGEYSWNGQRRQNLAYLVCGETKVIELLPQNRCGGLKIVIQKWWISSWAQG